MIKYEGGDQVEIFGQAKSLAALDHAFVGLLTSARLKRIEEVIEQRTLSLIPVMENIYDRGNISAAMRSAESMGLLEFQIVEYANQKFKAANRVSNGSDKWLRIKEFARVADCVSDLRSRQYQIFVTKLSDQARPISFLDFSKPTAIVFGNEKMGVSEEMTRMSDGEVIIPMRGFSQSYNISVAAALAFYHASLSQQQKLSEIEKIKLRLEYRLKSLTHPEQVLERIN